MIGQIAIARALPGFNNLGCLVIPIYFRSHLPDHFGITSLSVQTTGRSRGGAQGPQILGEKKEIREGRKAFAQGLDPPL